jgi:hypothetical protein
MDPGTSVLASPVVYRQGRHLVSLAFSVMGGRQQKYNTAISPRCASQLRSVSLVGC